MKLLQRSLVYLLVGSSLNACVEQVDINDFLKSESSASLVVEGLITNELRQHEVKLTRSAGAIPEKPYEPVSEAEVTLTDGTETFPLTETPPGSGIYLTDSIVGKVNTRYELIVKVNGKVYTASDTMLRSRQFTPADAHVLNLMPLIIFGSSNPAMVSTTVDNPKPTDESTRMDYYYFPGVDPDYVLINFAENLPHEAGTKLTQRKYSLSDEHYQFIRALLLETEKKGGGFGSIRSNVPTNVKNGGLGFFGASSVIVRKGEINSEEKLIWK